jgi:hypothetical protein
LLRLVKPLSAADRVSATHCTFPCSFQLMIAPGEFLSFRG